MSPRRLRTYRDLTEPDRSGILPQVVAQREKVAARLAAVRHVVAVMSDKGGVDKSFLTAGLAVELARSGRRVGVLDADLHGPTAARMLGVTAGGRPLEVREDGVAPAAGSEGVRVISSDLLLAEGAPLRWKEPEHERFVWRGTLEAGVLREFLGDVAWGELDLLLVDLPPGAERFQALTEFVASPKLAGVVVVTIPSDASLRAVRRSVRAAREAGVPILGVVENFAGYACGRCGHVAPLFRGEAGAALARDAAAPVLSRVPFEAAAQDAADAGRLATGGRAAAAVREAAAALLARIEPQ